MISVIGRNNYYPMPQSEVPLYKPIPKASETFAEMLAEEERKLSVGYIKTMEVLRHERL